LFKRPHTIISYTNKVWTITPLLNSIVRVGWGTPNDPV